MVKKKKKKARKGTYVHTALKLGGKLGMQFPSPNTSLVLHKKKIMGPQ